MAKSRSFFGLRRGSTKSHTFQVLNGRQVTKDRVTDVRNPRTSAQMSQRSAFSDAVKFYSKGVQNLFKFAFEGKRANESDYNAFMRVNAKRGVELGKEASGNPLYPALGDWIMTQGSLATLAPEISDNLNAYELIVNNLATTDDSWGKVCAKLIADFGFMDGDILTIVKITAPGITLSNMPSVTTPEEARPSIWDIKQYSIDAASTAPIPTGISVASGLLTIAASTTSAQGCAIIVSRPLGSNLKVTTSILCNNSIAGNLITDMKEAPYLRAVGLSWQTREDAILEGSLLP